MAKPQLNPKILEKLSNKLGIQQSTVRQNISKLKQTYPSCTLNAVAQIYARSKGLTVQQQLSAADRASMPHIEAVKENPKIVVKPKPKREAVKTIISYETPDHFVAGHIKEINRTYTAGCYTATYILIRKVIENLIVDILQAKYPPDASAANKELYWDLTKKRFKDFSVILKNLFDKKDDFTPTKRQAIERLNQLAKSFKDEANNKTHSWFHLVNRAKEIDDLEPQKMIELIKTIEK